MNILPIKLQNNIQFKCNKDFDVIAYDDYISKEKRNLIREHYDSWHMPYQSIYEKESQLNTYQLKILIDKWKAKHPIQQVGNTTIYRGQTLVDDECTLHNLKGYKINTVIDLVDYGKDYKEKVEKAGLNYYCYGIYDNWWNRFDYSAREFIEPMVKFLKIMQQGNIYIGCQHGDNDTDIAMILNDFFNPKLANKCKTDISPAAFSMELNTIFDAITPSERKLLGWNKEFEQNLMRRLLHL